MLNHREGLSVFVDRPQVPLDNNKAERFLRGPAIGRGLSFGSDSEDGAKFTAIMYSVAGTLSMNGIDVLRWLEAWLTACAKNGRKPPEDLSPWLPWSMSEEDRREIMRRDDRRDRVPLLRSRLHRGRDGAAARPDRRRSAAQPPSPVEGVLPAHRLAQARRRAQGHDGPGHHAGHAQGRRDRPAAAKWRQGRPRPIVFGPETEPPLFPAPTSLDQVRPLDLRSVVRGTGEGRLWNEFVARYHYLGYKTLVGAQMRYAVHDRDGWPVAMLGFSTAAWKLAPRDNFIGWTPQLREKNLPLVVDNPRFLILPWIKIPNLGSHILALIRPPPARGLDRALQTPPPCSSRPSSRPRASPARSIGPRAGSMSVPPRGAGATTATSSTTSRARTSGSARSEKIGNAPSIVKSHPVAVEVCE